MNESSSPPARPTRVGLLITCLTDTFFPRVGRAVVGVLRHHGCEVVFPEGQTCCGQPAYNSGLFAEARSLLLRLPRLFEGVEHVVSPSGSCVAMIRHHAAAVGRTDEERERLRELGRRTWEFSSFLEQVLGIDPATIPARGERKATYHYSCHLREIAGLEDATASVGKVLGEAFVPLPRSDQCCGFGGTFAVDYPEISDGMLEDKLACIRDSGAETLVCNEGGCGLHIAGGLHRAGSSVRVIHVAELMAESLGLLDPAERSAS